MTLGAALVPLPPERSPGPLVSSRVH
jgi:hypothetical protein